jgi:aminoglycoside phosphotransferase (APT) family kinase protein
MGELLAAIHGIEQEAFGYRTTEILDPEPTNRAFMTRWNAERLDRYARFGGDGRLHDAVVSYFAERAELFAQCTGPRLLHYDFHEGNVIVDRTPHGPVLTGCVDVENAVAGDPLADLAKLDLYSIQGDEVKLGGLLDGYGALPNDWRDRVALYRLVCVLELWDWYRDIGEPEHLAGLADDMRAITSAG